MKIRLSIIYLIVVVVLSEGHIAYAQQTSQIDIADAEQWVMLGTYDTVLVEYDLQSLRYTDSGHIVVLIKTTPIAPVVKKLLQENNIGLHPVSAYNGYEYYSHTIREETIDLKQYKYTTLNTWDYDVLGGLLDWTRIPQQPKQALASSPESTLIKEVMSVITRIVLAKAD